MNCKSVGVKLGLVAAVTLTTLTVGVNVSYAAPEQKAIISTATYQADLNKSYLVADEPTETSTRITTDFLNVRTSPSTDANILGVLNIGAEVQGTQEGEWFKIQYSGQTAYIHADWLRGPGSSAKAVEQEDEKEEVVARYTTDNLNVRTGKGTSFNILGVLSKGTKISGSYTGEWFKIEYDGQTAYVHTDYLKGSQEEVKEAVENRSLTTQYATAYVNVRTGPGTRHSILGVMKPNTKVEGNYEGHWFKTTFAGETAYVSGSYLSDGESEVEERTVAPEDRVTRYTKASLNVRKGPGTNTSILGVLNPGTEVKGAADGEWFQFEYDGQTAYVYNPYLVSSQPNTNRAEETVAAKSVSASSGAIESIVNDAWAQVGKSYVYGTAGPNTFDCSGLTYYLYNKHAGIQLPRSSASQATAGTTVSKSEIQAGDLIFFINPGASRIGHVGIYVGGGTYIHASTPATGVKTDSISGSYFQNNAVTIKRILP